MIIEEEPVSLASAEELRGWLEDADEVYLAAGQRAGYPGPPPVPRPEADSPGAVVGRTACSWCGRSSPEGGLTESYPRPPHAAHAEVTGHEHGVPVLSHAPPEPAQVDNSTDMHCRDEHGCQRAREESEAAWRRRQYADWVRREAAWQASRAWGAYHQDQLARLQDAEFTAALAAVREASTPRPEFAEAVSLALSAALEGPGLGWPQQREDGPPVAPAPPWDPWGHVLGRNRAHTYGGRLEALYGPAPVTQPPAPGRSTRRGRGRRPVRKLRRSASINRS